MLRGSRASIAVSVLVAGGLAAVGLVATAGVSQAARVPKVRPLYVSLGDSYSIGFQPGVGGTGGTPGYTAFVAKRQRMQLENFGCGGATTNSILNTIGCRDPAATDAVLYSSTTQEAAALSFIAAHPGNVGLITVSIGGNDITSCAGSPNPVTCITTATNKIRANVTTLVTNLNSALASAKDTNAKIVGLTYPDVVLGTFVFPPGSPNVTLAQESIAAFDVFLNPTLKSVYTAVPEGTFVNVTQAPYRRATAGDDTPLTKRSVFPHFGRIPNAVGEICQLTHFCTSGNIHANTKGYNFIGRLIVADLRSH